MTYLKLADSFVNRLHTYYIYTHIAKSTVAGKFSGRQEVNCVIARRIYDRVHNQTTHVSIGNEILYVVLRHMIFIPLLLLGFVEFCIELLVAGNLIEFIAALKFCGSSV